MVSVSGMALGAANLKICVQLTDVIYCFFQIEESVAKKDKKYNIMAILSNCNVFLITLLCSFLWYVCEFFQMCFHKCRTEGLDEASSVCAGVESVVLDVCRIVITISYYGLILNTSNLHGDPYLNSFLSAVTEVPAYLIALLSLQYLSRRFCQASTLFIGGVMILCVHLIPIGN